MQNAYGIAPTAAPHKGLAVASLTLGILSVLIIGSVLKGFFSGTLLTLTFGVSLVVAVTGLALGRRALEKADCDPRQYGGSTLARMGVTISIMGLGFILLAGGIAAAIIPHPQKSDKYTREVAALKTVKSIGEAQLQYAAAAGKGEFTDLKTLGAHGLIDARLASGETGGYRFASAPVAGSGSLPMFNTKAWPVSEGPFGTGDRSFYSNETGLLYEADGSTPPSATPDDCVPKDGTLIGP